MLQQLMAPLPASAKAKHQAAHSRNCMRFRNLVENAANKKIKL
jgi:hypothetical protein